ncbi:MAG: histidine kinase [Bacteroidetes bacterium]|jgi:two-component system, LytTR family, sensor kinase|nr:histidine kinase [Bacteroidota bacterium]MBT4726988.1 histidine kinase [Bacteroidota bacterium]
MYLSKNKIEKWLPHFIGLLLFLILPIFVFDRNNDRAIYWMYSYYYQLAFMIAAFYVNYLVIVPRFFFSKRKVYFFVIIFLFTVLLLAISQYLYDTFQFENLHPNNNIPRGDMPPRSRLGLHPKLVDNFFLLVIVLGFSSGMAIIQRLRKNESKQKEIEKAHVDSELAFLKNQISPHFFFNALNNIYGLIAIDSDKAQQAVEKLSGLMRYLIYDSNIDAIELQKEFDFTLKYIELMEQRLSSKVKLNVDISPNIPEVQTPPLLFIPFIENAFKHGISYRENSFVSILLKTENNNVVFDCKNSIPTSNEQKDTKGGVGITNIQKRLDLIYGNLFKLDISKADKEYHVQLIVPFKIK